MSSAPYISVIVPVHNSERYLRSAIESILYQDEALDFEVLLVDDGSTDGSGAICDQYVTLDSRVRVFHIGNCGVSAARNIGIDNSRGEWLLFVDSDDELMPTAFRLFKDGISDDTAMCMAGYEVYNQNGELDFHVEQRLSSTISIKDCLLQMYHPMYYYYQGYLWDKLFKAGNIRNSRLRFDEEISFNEDRLFTVQYLCNCTGTVYYSTAPVYKYYKRESGAMASLEKGLNLAFVTDFDAQVKMFGAIKAKVSDKDVIRAAREGVLGSYDNIIAMFRHFGYHDEIVEGKMKNKLRHALGTYYFSTMLTRKLHQFKRSIKRIWA